MNFLVVALGVVLVVNIAQWIQIMIMLRSLVLLTVAASGHPVPSLEPGAGWFDRQAHTAVTGALASMRAQGF